MIDLFTPVPQDKIICTMHANGNVSWVYHLWNDRMQHLEILSVDHKTAVVEIELQMLSITSKQMKGDDLIITYSK